MESSETEFQENGHGRTPQAPDELSESSADVSASEVAPRRFYTASLLGLFAAYRPPPHGANDQVDP